MKNYFLIFFLLLYCQRIIVLDENILSNKKHEGFLTRDVFQIIVEIPYSIQKYSLVRLRKQCLKDSIEKRNDQFLTFINEERKKQKKTFIKPELLDIKYNWFFKNTELFYEDYSKKEFCRFVYRTAYKNLFEEIIK